MDAGDSAGSGGGDAAVLRAVTISLRTEQSLLVSFSFYLLTELPLHWPALYRRQLNEIGIYHVCSCNKQLNCKHLLLHTIFCKGENCIPAAADLRIVVPPIEPTLTWLVQLVRLLDLRHTWLLLQTQRTGTAVGRTPLALDRYGQPRNPSRAAPSTPDQSMESGMLSASQPAAPAASTSDSSAAASSSQTRQSSRLSSQTRR